MAIYGVTIPIKGSLYIEVEAEDEDAAIEAARRDGDITHFEDWHTCRVGGEAELLVDPAHMPKEE